MAFYKCLVVLSVLAAAACEETKEKQVERPKKDVIHATLAAAETGFAGYGAYPNVDIAGYPAYNGIYPYTGYTVAYNGLTYPGYKAGYSAYPYHTGYTGALNYGAYPYGGYTGLAGYKGAYPYNAGYSPYNGYAGYTGYKRVGYPYNAYNRFTGYTGYNPGAYDDGKYYPGKY